MEKEIKLYHSKPLKDEIEPWTINLVHSGKLEAFEEDPTVVFIVKGEIFDIEHNTKLSFDKWFETKESAVSYLASMSKKYPLSEIILIEQKERNLSLYI